MSNFDSIYAYRNVSARIDVSVQFLMQIKIFAVFNLMEDAIHVFKLS